MVISNIFKPKNSIIEVVDKNVMYSCVQKGSD
jgi:hypothetical protein